MRLWQLYSLYFFNLHLLRFFFFLEYRLLDFDLIALIGGYLNLRGVDRRWKYFGLGFKNFRLSFDDLFYDHLGSHLIVLLLELLVLYWCHRDLRVSLLRNLFDFFDRVITEK